MKIEPMETDAALKQGLTLPFALVRSLSQVTLGPTPEAVNEGELLEARFFDPETEIRVFRDEGRLRAVRLTGETGDITLERHYDLTNGALFGRSVTLCQVLDFDEDGQSYVLASRLTGWEACK